MHLHLVDGGRDGGPQREQRVEAARRAVAHADRRGEPLPHQALHAAPQVLEGAVVAGRPVQEVQVESVEPKGAQRPEARLAHARVVRGPELRRDVELPPAWATTPHGGLRARAAENLRREGRGARAAAAAAAARAVLPPLSSTQCLGRRGAGWTPPRNAALDAGSLPVSPRISRISPHLVSAPRDSATRKGRVQRPADRSLIAVDGRAIEVPHARGQRCLHRSARGGVVPKLPRAEPKKRYAAAAAERHSWAAGRV
mmetsp:Transcript_18881/g.60301  ORF Transcript_18881/g.60301 Transcript_18881/m.60301 type:complete len:256 (-) Transcript_18881:80-847(-)